eukprot:809861-Prorocentrum_minimum.AAC.3
MQLDLTQPLPGRTPVQGVLVAEPRNREAFHKIYMTSVCVVALSRHHVHGGHVDRMERRSLLRLRNEDPLYRREVRLAGLTRVY